MGLVQSNRLSVPAEWDRRRSVDYGVHVSRTLPTRRETAGGADPYARRGRRLVRGACTWLSCARVQPGSFQSAEIAARLESRQEKDRHAGQLSGDKNSRFSRNAHEVAQAPIASS